MLVDDDIFRWVFLGIVAPLWASNYVESSNKDSNTTVGDCGDYPERTRVGLVWKVTKSQQPIQGM